jgi:hypothetical protein
MPRFLSGLITAIDSGPLFGVSEMWTKLDMGNHSCEM